MSNQATMNFDQALPYLRRGFILRIHGDDRWNGGQLREQSGKLEFSQGDSNWGSAADLPLLDLAFDVYDQKKVEYVDYTKPLIERDPGAKALTKQEADASAADELLVGNGNHPEHVSDEEWNLQALAVLRDQGVEDPSDTQVSELVGQLRARSKELDPVVKEGGNTPPPSDPRGLQSLTQGYNEHQTDQVLPGEAEGGFGAPEPEQLFDTSAEDDAGDIPDEETQVAEGDQSVKKHKRHKRG